MRIHGNVVQTQIIINCHEFMVITWQFVFKSALPLPSPLGVELGWSQTGVRMEIGWRNPLFSPSWSVPFSSCKETTFMLRPRDRYSVTALQHKKCYAEGKKNFFIPNRSLADLSIGITALSGRHAWPTWAVQSRLNVACFSACFPLSYRVTKL